MAEKLKSKEAIVEAIGNLTVFELQELVKLMEEKFEVSSSMPALVPASHSGAGTSSSTDSAGPTEEKTEFTIVLTSAGQNKIPVIKLVREITALGLKEAKDLVDGVPKTVKENVNKEQAQELQKKFQELGATVELK